MKAMAQGLQMHEKVVCVVLCCWLWLILLLSWYLYAVPGLSAAGFNEMPVETVQVPAVEVRALIDKWALNHGWVISETHRDSSTGGWNLVVQGSQARMVLNLLPDSPLATRIAMNVAGRGQSAGMEVFADMIAFVRNGGGQPDAGKELGPVTENSNIPAGNASADAVAGQGTGTLQERFSRLVACMVIHQEDGDIQVSGLYIPEKGGILTTAHDMTSVKSVSITMGDGAELVSRKLSMDRNRDLAMVKIGSLSSDFLVPSWRTVPLRRGEEVYFIGCPLHQGLSMRSGTVEGPRNMGGQLLWQVHMVVEPGSSGSPVFDSSGRLAGVIKGRLRNDHHEGFIIPLDTVREFLSKGRQPGSSRSMRYQLPIFRGVQ